MKKLEDMTKAELDEYVQQLCAPASRLSADDWWAILDRAPEKLARAWKVEQEGTWLQAERRVRGDWGGPAAEIFNPQHSAEEVIESADDSHCPDCVAHWSAPGLYGYRGDTPSGCASSLAEAQAAADAVLLADGWLLAGEAQLGRLG